MGIAKSPVLLLKLPLLVILFFLQAVLTVLGRLSGLLAGMLALILSGFWIFHCTFGNWDNVVLLSVSLTACIGIPVLIQTATLLVQMLGNTIL